MSDTIRSGKATMRGLTVAFIFCSALISTGLMAQQSAPVEVGGNDFDANYFGVGVEGRYGVIVLSGSGGGRADSTAARIAAMGYNVLSLAYYDRGGSETVPQTLEMIPVEYFEAPKNWLMSLKSTRDDGIILYGLSKGAELSLVLASYDANVKAVIALAPSHVVWQGVPASLSEIMTSPSSWSRANIGLPFVPYISSQQQAELGFENRHQASLTNLAAVSEARIKVENIQGPVLLLSGGRDANWPSSMMGEEICRSIHATSSFQCSHVTYESGDHLLTQHEEAYFSEVGLFLRAVWETRGQR
jgi:pimeloyl-ACP methyl ester carboxylesterase